MAQDRVYHPHDETQAHAHGYDLQDAIPRTFSIPDAVYDDLAAGLGVTAFAVYVALKRYALGGPTCRPSQGTIAAKLGMSRKAVNEAFTKLRAAGLIVTETRVNGAGRRTSDLVTLPWPPVPVDGDPVTLGYTPDVTQGYNSAVTQGYIIGSRQERSTQGEDTPAGLVTGTPVDYEVLAAAEQSRRGKAQDRAVARRPRAAAIRDDWRPSEASVAYARERGFDPGALALAFTRHQRAKGVTAVDFDPLFLRWVDREVEFRAERERPTLPPSSDRKHPVW